MTLEVTIQPGCVPGGGSGRSGGSAPPPPATLVSRSNLAALYWTLPQMVAHHAVSGCPLRPGDLLASGTISSPGSSGGCSLGAGCLVEKTWGGSRPFALAGGGGKRTYLQDGDRVVMTGWAQGAGFRVGFGECAGVLLPAHPPEWRV